MKPTVVSVLGILMVAASLKGEPFQNGDVFVALVDGQIVQASKDGQIRGVLNTEARGALTGMCFDVEKNLYVTNFQDGTMSKFDQNGRLIIRRWGGPFATKPESCVVDAAGNIYTGETDGENRIHKFNSDGGLLDSFSPRVEDRGVDWIDLATDQCTMYYTSEGKTVMRYDVCRGRQLKDFVQDLSPPCFALRLRENGEVLVTCARRIYRLGRDGTKLQDYAYLGDRTLLALSLDPDGIHFWTGSISGDVYKVHIETGSGLTKAVFDPTQLLQPGPQSKDLTSPLQALMSSANPLGGLAVYGEQTAATRMSFRQPKAENRRHEQAPQRSAVEERRRLTPYQESYALVIGIDRYHSDDWPDLNYATSDAKAVTFFLERQGFEVLSLYNSRATQGEIKSAAIKLARQLEKDDRVLIFFAGHGYTEVIGEQEWGYVVPYDATDDSASYLSMEELRTLSAKMGKAKHQLFVMDACFGGMLAVTRGQYLLDPSRPDYIEELGRRKARHILSAGGKGQQVLDSGPDGHSYFTGYLLKGLHEAEADLNGDGYITFIELSSYVTSAASNAYQTPLVSTLPQHEGGQFIFQISNNWKVAKPASEFVSITVNKGATLFQIAKCYEPAGDLAGRMEVLARYNALLNPNEIVAGMRLKIPLSIDGLHLDLNCRHIN